MTLPSRQRYTPEQFVAEFLSTLTPALIPREGFVQWQTIRGKLVGLEEGVEYYAQLGQRLAEGADWVSEVSDSVLAADDPGVLVRCAFELIGHTDRWFATRQDDLAVPDLAQSIREGDPHAARRFATILHDVGFGEILRTGDVGAVLLGVQVGLESHRRKRVGGEAFTAELGYAMAAVVRSLAEAGIMASVDREVVVRYEGGTKRVDFVLSAAGCPPVAVEGNFYIVTGSKPTEMKRSYADVGRRLAAAGITLVWVTDGKGYRSMKRSLRDAFTVFPNIYNLAMVGRDLASDIASLRQHGQ